MVITRQKEVEKGVGREKDKPMKSTQFSRYEGELLRHNPMHNNR